MMNVHDFRCGTFDKSHPLHGASHMHSRCHNCSPGDIPGHIHGPLEDCELNLGSSSVCLSCHLATSCLWRKLILIWSWCPYSHRCWISSQRSRFSSWAGNWWCWSGGCLASRKSLHPWLEVQDSWERPKGEGLRCCFDAFDDVLEECPSSRGG
jgi:hypothetical protein